MKKILAVIAFVIVVPRLLKGESSEEPADFQDIPMGSPQTQNLLVSHCPTNFATTAGTLNFALSEFHSKDGTLVPEMYQGYIQILMEQLEIIRTHFGGLPVIINSGYRSPNHNTNVGGTSNSRHTCGMAADFVIPGISNNEVQQGVLQLIQEGKIIDGGVGRYNTFTHYDISNSRRWDKR